jgi:hypothetical protein
MTGKLKELSRKILANEPLTPAEQAVFEFECKRQYYLELASQRPDIFDDGRSGIVVARYAFTDEGDEE